MNCWKNPKIFITLVFALLFVIGGVVLLFSNELIFQILIKRILTLRPNNHVYDIWKKNPLPIKMNFYFFNWTNPQDINNNDVKPNFEQIGPYSFIEEKEKINITWNKNNTVTFNQLKYWFFDKDNSPNNLTDVVTTLNLVSLVSLLKIFTKISSLRKSFN